MLLAPLSVLGAEIDLSKLPPASSKTVDFEKQIKPILEASCLKCHSGEKPKGKYSLETRAGMLKESDEGPNVIPGESAKSRLIHYVAGLVEEMEMPPTDKGDPLSKEQIGLLRAWIDQGAKWPDGLVLKAPPKDSKTKSEALPPPVARKVDFVKEVQPIFEAHCYRCHGPQRAEAGFRLDAKEAALAGGDLGTAILPGQSERSLLIRFVAGVEETIMPQKGDRLSAEQVGILRAWIDQGAHWPDGIGPKLADKRDHWAFKAPVRAQEPRLKSNRARRWARNAIDRFVAAKLEEEKLAPAPEADRITLCRRLYLDLIGLPPTPQEVDSFLADRSADAIEKLVEKLLSSPHYGERWGRHWLDLARYADTNGYEKDRERSVWPYRDYVIRAFERDLPFDQFTIEQLAGDLLPNATLDQRVATGFLRNSMLNQEGGIEPEQFRMDAMFDRLDAIGRTWLGLTINCSQCHNHKYDPISQREYYQIFSFLNNDDEPFIEVPTPEQQKKRDEVMARVRELETKGLRETTDLASRMAAWEKEIANAAGDWQVLDPAEWHNFATKFEEQPDHSLLGGGDLQREAVMHVWVDTALTNITGFRLEALTHPNLPYNGPGLMERGSFLLKEFTCEAYAMANPTVTNQVKFRRAAASREASGFGVSKAIDGDQDKGGWTTSLAPVDRNREDRAVFECAEPIAGFPGGTRLKFTLYQKSKEGGPQKESGLDNYSLGRFRLSATTAAAPLAVDPLTPGQRRLLAKPAEQRTADETRELFNVFRRQDRAFESLNKAIADAWTNWVYAPTTLALQQRSEPRTTRIFKRGDWQKPGDKVEPDVPSILHPLPEKAPRNRLGFAQWLVDRRSPTTARVVVNRIWQAYFGQGLFTTPEDIGTRCETPSHPELLDWLAVEFMESGWSFKHMHRLITSSATYRQSSKLTPELLAKDPYNRLLARGPRFRVEGEIVQDIALAASGLLNRKIGGPSVRPPIPGSVGDTVYGGFSWPESTGADRYRRAMYTFWKRSLPFPALLAFDQPTAEVSCPRRVRSNTPLQALTTLNEKTFVEAAQAMGLRVLKEGGSDEQSRARFAFRLCTGRSPTDRELKSILEFWDEQFRYFEERTAAALSVALPDPKNVPAEVNLHKAAAWAMVSRALLNLDETITKE